MIEDFGLHDSTLVALHVDWGEGICILTVRHTKLSECTLTFKEVSNLVVSRNQPWGRSRSINTVCENVDGQYEIEMQSGDLIRIAATEVSFASTGNS